MTLPTWRRRKRKNTMPPCALTERHLRRNIQQTVDGTAAGRGFGHLMNNNSAGMH